MRMNVNLRKGRVYRWSAYVLVLFFALTFYRFAAHESLLELREMWRQEQQVEQSIQQLREENARIEAAIKELAPEGSGIERIARQDLGLSKPGEIVVKIPEKR